VLDRELAFLILSLLAAVVGPWSIIRASADLDSPGRSSGRLVFLATLLALGAATVIAAVHQAQGLVPLGLTAGFLVVGILWDGPRPGHHPADLVVKPDEN
jgi:hypothetical protein